MKGDLRAIGGPIGKLIIGGVEGQAGDLRSIQVGRVDFIETIIIVIGVEEYFTAIRRPGWVIFGGFCGSQAARVAHRYPSSRFRI